MQISKNILVAPLHWGLGHATRCIPIIEAILENGDNPIIASDGEALLLLKKEFPALTFYELPSYNIRYAAPGKSLKWKMVTDTPYLIATIIKEHIALKRLIKLEKLDGVISDNRMGMFSSKIPCVYITHQTTVLSGNTTWFTTKMHRTFIKKFSKLWIPDLDVKNNLTGLLSSDVLHDFKTTYIGPLSRFSNNGTYQKKYDLLVLLSGPEPQRSLLEDQLLLEVKKFKGEVLFIAGLVEPEQQVIKKGNVTYYNYLSTQGLQKALDRSAAVLSRSGYTTIMDLCKLGKKAFFIPTPGQYEQEYLAQRLEKAGVAPFALQDDFNITMLDTLVDYKGFEMYAASTTSMSSIGRLLDDAFSSVNENSDPIPGSLST